MYSSILVTLFFNLWDLALSVSPLFFESLENNDLRSYMYTFAIINTCISFQFFTYSDIFLYILIYDVRYKISYKQLFSSLTAFQQKRRELCSCAVVTQGSDPILFYAFLTSNKTRVGIANGPGRLINQLHQHCSRSSKIPSAGHVQQSKTFLPSFAYIEKCPIPTKPVLSICPIPL